MTAEALAGVLEVRSLSARTYIAEGMAPETVQTLLGHAHAEMTAIYLNDRGLTEAEWKTVQANAAHTEDRAIS
jgi:integrase